MLKFAVIGVGRMGKRHTFNLARGLLHGVTLAAVCDIDGAALEWCEKYAGKAKRYTDFRLMLREEKLDGVIIATPHYAHEQIAVACIEAGVNTLSEKPLAVTTQAAKNIIAAAERNPAVKVGVSFNQRSNRMYKKAKALLESGELGRIQRVDFVITDWYRSQAYYNQGGWRASYNGEGGGCLINQCVHQLDVLSWLTGTPKSVCARIATVGRNITVENDVSAILDYGEFKCTFSASTHELKGTNRLEIACDKGKIVIGPLIMKTYRHKSEGRVNAETEKGYGFALSFKRTSTYGFFTALADLVKGQQLRSLRAFRNSVRGTGEMLAPVQEGLRAVELFNAIYLSGWMDGQCVTLPLDDAKYETALEQKRQEEIKNDK